FEKVGTRDWMPPWAHTGTRVDNVQPSFDVFCLGKVLWSMISGQPFLPYWYWDKPQNDLRLKFPNQHDEMEIVSEILAVTVVENEADCVVNAYILRQMINNAISVIERRGQRFARGVQRTCLVCGRGRYEPVFSDKRLIALVDAKKLPSMTAFGSLYDGENRMDVRSFHCNWCGHVQMFRFDPEPPLAWRR